MLRVGDLGKCRLADGSVMTKLDERQLKYAVRTKLREYIDALWVGRAGGADAFLNLYLERLAVAARLMVLLDFWRANIETMREIVRQENHAFPRALLSTDDGRNARAAFNLFARAVSALENYNATAKQFSSGPQSIVGRQLSTVSFVWDYVQLIFDDCGFNVFCPMTISTSSDITRSKDAEFKDKICKLIGQIVRNIDVSEAKIEISFELQNISWLLEDNVASPEAYSFFSQWSGIDYFAPI
jgi:hypothetical protein